MTLAYSIPDNIKANFAPTTHFTMMADNELLGMPGVRCYGDWLFYVTPTTVMYCRKVMELTSEYVLDLIFRALNQFNSPHVENLSYDGDHKSNELIITLNIGNTPTEYILRSKYIEKLN